MLWLLAMGGMMLVSTVTANSVLCFMLLLAELLDEY